MNFFLTNQIFFFLKKASLPGVGYNPVTTFFEGERLYCGCNGKLFILCVKTGNILATNRKKIFKIIKKNSNLIQKNRNDRTGLRIHDFHQQIE